MFSFKKFLFEDLLLEDKVEYIVKQQGEKLFAAFEKDKGQGKPKAKDGAEVAEYLAKEFSEKYLQWLANLYSKGGYSLEDKNKIKGLLTTYDKARPKLEKKDLNAYKTIKELEDTLAPFEAEDLKSNRQLSKEKEAKFFKDKEAKLFYDKGGVKVVIPKTEAASCFFGVGTKWCTAATNHNMFDNYSKQGNLYIVFTDDGRKYQFFFRMKSQQMMDEKDHPIVKKDWMKMLDKYPDLYDAFGPIAKKQGFLMLIKEPSSDDYIKAMKNDIRDVVLTAHEMKRPLPDEAAKEALQSSGSFASAYHDAFTRSQIIDHFTTSGDSYLYSEVAGWLRNVKDVSEKEFNTIFDSFIDRAKKQGRYGNQTLALTKNIFDDNEMKKYKSWIQAFSSDKKEELCTLDEDFIEIFEDDVSENFKIELIKKNPDVIKKFKKPTGKMTQNHQWAMKAKDPRYKRGF